MLLPDDLSAGQPSPNAPKNPRYIGLETSLAFQAELVADLVYARNFDDSKVWQRCVGTYMTIWLDDARGSAFAEAVLSHYSAIDKVSSPIPSLSLAY